MTGDVNERVRTLLAETVNVEVPSEETDLIDTGVIDSLALERVQVAAHEHEVGDVLDHLLHDARSRGASGIQGRVEAHLRAPLSRRRAVFHASGFLALLHSRDAGILHAIQSGWALLTRLEGEWWMGHHLEPFGGAWVGTP